MLWWGQEEREGAQTSEVGWDGGSPSTAVGRDGGRAPAGIELASPAPLPVGAAGECRARPRRVQALGSLLPIFLGTLNQANTRNWATAAVTHADFYTVLNLSLLFCN